MPPREEPVTVASAYDRWSTQYDGNENLTRDLDARVVREAPLHIADKDVVEIGCGTGKNTVWLSASARSVVALDFSAGMLAVARERVHGDNVQFIAHDIRAPWPMGADVADVVIGNLVLEHVADLGPVFREAVRVLRPGGQLFLCELHPFKQLVGGQARFTDQATGELVLVTAHRHSVGEYVNGGIDAGLVLKSLGEWFDDNASGQSPPRLLSVLFERPTT